jgi:hypothetical protein
MSEQHGGRRHGAGRPKGAESANTKARREAIKLAVAKFEATTPGVFDGDGVALMQLIYRDPNQDIALRLDAAKAAARFERPQLSAAIVKDITPLPSTPSAIDAAIAELLERASGGAPTIIDGRIAGGACEPDSGGSDAAAEVVAGS